MPPNQRFKRGFVLLQHQELPHESLSPVDLRLLPVRVLFGTGFGPGSTPPKADVKTPEGASTKTPKAKAKPKRKAPEGPFLV